MGYHAYALPDCELEGVYHEIEGTLYKIVPFKTASAFYGAIMGRADLVADYRELQHSQISSESTENVEPISEVSAAPSPKKRGRPPKVNADANADVVAANTPENASSPIN